MKKAGWITILLVLIVWGIVSLVIHNDILIPYPLQTVIYLRNLLSDVSFYQAVISTLYRCTKGYLISMVCAFLFSVLSYQSRFFKSLFEPIRILLESIPNISYILMAILWLGAEGSVSLVTSMILIPVFYSGFYNGICRVNPSVLEVVKIYKESPWNELKYFLLPYSKVVLLTTGKTAAGMALKVGVMAEIIGQVRNGIGKQMYLSKIYLDTTGIFAFTIVILLLSFGIGKLFDFYYGREMKKEQRAFR